MVYKTRDPSELGTPADRLGTLRRTSGVNFVARTVIVEARDLCEE